MELRASGCRSRGFKLDRQKALKALTQAFLHYLNLATHQVEASIGRLSDECGLSTVSASGVKNITRASRVIDILDSIGLLRKVKVWDKVSGTYLPTYIELLPRFFDFINVKAEVVKNARKKHQARMQKRLIPEHEAGLLSVSELKAVAQKAHIQKSFEYRKTKRVEAKMRRLAKQASEVKAQYGYSAFDCKVALQCLIEAETTEIAAKTLRHLVNRRKAYYRSFESPS